VEGGQYESSETAPNRKWAYPQGLRRVDPDDEGTDEAVGPEVLLDSFSPTDAKAVCTRLEGEGIACEMAARPDDGGASGGQQLVDVFVADADLPLAREILCGSPPANEEGDEEFEEEVARLKAHRGVCPKCRHSGLEILPLTSTARALRNACFFYIASAALILYFSSELSRDAVDYLSEFLGIGILLAIVILIWIAIARMSRRRCAECDWRSDQKE
jgi:hypothetical protein